MKSNTKYECAWCKQCFTRNVLIKRHLILCRVQANITLNNLIKKTNKQMLEIECLRKHMQRLRRKINNKHF